MADNLDTRVSTTNLQVAGVDEADLVETDGSFLYIVSGQDLVIVSAGEGEDLKVVSRVHLDQRPTGMYLSGNRLAILSSSGETNSFDGVRLFPLMNIDTFVHSARSYPSEDHQPTLPPRPRTTVMVLDITVCGAPTLVQKTQLDGQLVASRTVDGELRLVLTNELRLPSPIAKLVPDKQGNGFVYAPTGEGGTPNLNNFIMTDVWWPGSYGSNYVYESQDEYVARVYDEVLDALGARVRSLAADGSVISDKPLFDVADIYRPDRSWARNVTTVATFNLNSNHAGTAAKVSVVTGDGVQVYATADSIYVFTEKPPSNNANGVLREVAGPRTDVWKFAMDGKTHSIKLAAKGEFDGTLLNQFAADEHDGYLRVVTKSDNWSGTGQSVLVLQQTGDHLNVVGSVSGIAAGESLYSVRFAGDRVFLVTFRQFDPLFAVDLSVPTNPRLAGELHIPGYSDYLQFIDDTHLMAIGRQADVSSGWFEEVAELQVSIFDVSDLSSPQLTQRYSFGGGSTTVTPATGSSYVRGDGDAHAVSYFAEEHVLALPINSIDRRNLWWGSANEAPPLFEAGHGGLQVFKIDVDAGITPIGLIEHDTLIERSVRIGDRLFAISSGTLSVHNLTDPNVQLGEINIGEAAAMPPVELQKYRAAIDKPHGQLSEAPTYLPDNAPYKALVADGIVGATASNTGWVLPSLEQSRHPLLARVTAFSRFPASDRLDNDLLQVLAADTEGTSSDLFTHRDHPGGTESGESCEREASSNYRWFELASTLVPMAPFGQDRI